MAAGFLAASNIGKGLGLGHNLFLLWVIIALPTTSSSKSISNYPSLVTIEVKNLVILFAYKAEDYPANLEGKSVYATNLTPCFSTTFPFSINLQLPPASAAKSTITLPGFIALTCSSVSNSGAGFPGIKAVVIIISTSLHYFNIKAL